MTFLTEAKKHSTNFRSIEHGGGLLVRAEALQNLFHDEQTVLTKGPEMQVGPPPEPEMQVGQERCKSTRTGTIPPVIAYFFHAPLAFRN